MTDVTKKPKFSAVNLITVRPLVQKSIAYNLGHIYHVVCGIRCCGYRITFDIGTNRQDTCADVWRRALMAGRIETFHVLDITVKYSHTSVVVFELIVHVHKSIFVSARRVQRFMTAGTGPER